MATWLVTREELTNDQVSAIEAKPDRHRVFFGGPGSGKTIVLIYRARHLCDTYHVENRHFLTFVFNKALKQYIRSALDLLQLPENCVITFAQWCTDFYRNRISRHLPWDADAKQPDHGAIQEAVHRYLSTSPPNPPPYQFILVDEGQDLDASSFDIIRSIARHVTVCIDHKQRIYEKGASESEILKRLGLTARNASFLTTYRCCPYIIKLAGQLLKSAEEKTQFERQAKTHQTEKQTPLLYLAEDWEEERRRIAEVIRTRQQKGDRIAVLFHLNKHVYGYAKGLQEAGLDVEVLRAGKNQALKEVDFQSDLPKVLTYHGAKGITFDTVIMPRLVRQAFIRREDEDIRRLLFVGITRATKWVYMSATENEMVPVLKELLPLEQQGVLTVQRERTGGQLGPADGKREKDDLLDLL